MYEPRISGKGNGAAHGTVRSQEKDLTKSARKVTPNTHAIAKPHTRRSKLSHNC